MLQIITNQAIKQYAQMIRLIIGVYVHKLNICEQFVNNKSKLLTVGHFWSSILKRKKWLTVILVIAEL